MTTQEFTEHQLQNIRRRLLYWGRKNYQEYPWRTDTDAWFTFVAEVFLQRTQANQVKSVYEEFREHYPTPLSLLGVDPNEVFSLVRKLGLGSRFRLLRDIATVAVKHGGALPEDMDKLTRLRGVGTYTAAAWLSLHRGKRAVLIDCNVVRWLSRMTGNPYKRDPRGVSWVRDLAERLTPSRAFRAYNYAVLDFTMKICTQRSPACGHCPHLADCHYGSQVCLASKEPYDAGRQNGTAETR